MPALARGASQDPADAPAPAGDDVPTAFRRAAAWHPGPAADVHPWFFTVTGGPAWFGGDDLASTPGGAVQLSLAKSFTEHVYLVGSYWFGMMETETPVEGGGKDERWHDLHALTGGFGVRFDVSRDFSLFAEPRIGVIVGSDADVGPVGGVTAGLAYEIDTGITLRVEFTGLVTDTSLDTRGRDANLETIGQVAVGLQFEF